MAVLIALNKPFGVVCRFSRRDAAPTLADFIDVPRVYPAGRLDKDSEGLVLLTDDGRLAAAIAHPRYKLWKRYWVQVEGVPTERALGALREGIQIKTGRTRPARVRMITPPSGLWRRDPPVRYRRHIPTSWLEIALREGKNRQIRRMTAAVGFPTLRLIRTAIGKIDLTDLPPGHWRFIDPALI